MYLNTCLCLVMCKRPKRSEENIKALELELQAVVNHYVGAGPELGFSLRARSTLNPTPSLQHTN